MTDEQYQKDVLSSLTGQLLAWVAERPRTYGETIEAWGTHCPHFPIWEDAQRDRLVQVKGQTGGTMRTANVILTDAGRARLSAS